MFKIKSVFKTNPESKQLARLVALLAWLETQEAHVYIIQDRVEVDILGHDVITCLDIKYCTGIGMNLLEALEAAYLTRAQQTAS